MNRNLFRRVVVSPQRKPESKVPHCNAYGILGVQLVLYDRLHKETAFQKSSISDQGISTNPDQSSAS